MVERVCSLRLQQPPLVVNLRQDTILHKTAELGQDALTEAIGRSGLVDLEARNKY